MKTILIVEDDESLRESMRKLLEKEGFGTIEASSAEEGIEYLSKRKIDLILLDYCLKGIDGLQFLKITCKHPRPPVIMMTAYGDWSVVVDAVNHGAVDCLAKPVKKNELMTVIQGTLVKNNGHKG